MRSRVVTSVLVAVAIAVSLAPAAVPARSAAQSLVWVRTGGPIGGMGYDIRMRPGDTSRMYVTEAFAGVFRSADNGRTWSPSNSGITARTGESGDSIPVFCLTVDQNDPDTIWIGTQAVRGVYRSDDGGATWTEKVRGITEADGITFRGFTVDPRDSRIVYGAAEISSFAWAGSERQGREFDRVKGVVYKTTDGGEHWAAIWRGDNLARYVWLDPRDPDVICVSTGIFDREAANSDPVANTPGGVGVVKSTDGGQSWHSASTGLGNLYVGSLYMHPTSPDTLLAGTGNNAYRSGGGVYLSTNGGASWRRTLSSFDAITAVEYSVSSPNIAYAGSAGAIFRSTDRGATWRKMTTGYLWGPPGVAAGFPIDLQVDPSNPNRLFANNYGGGNFLSTDGGRTWTIASRGYTGAQVRAISVDPNHPGRVYVAARSGFFLTGDGGSSWSGIGRVPANVTECNALAIDPVGGSHLLAGTNMNQNLFASFDGGVSWRVVSRLRASLGWRALSFAPSDSRVAYAGAGAYYSAGTFTDTLASAGVYASSNGGLTWRAPSGAYSDANVAALVVHPTSAQRVFAATTNHGVLTSADGGLSWARLLGGLPSGSSSALSVAIDPAHPTILLAGYRADGVFRSTDGGASWVRSSVGLDPEASVSSIVFDPNDTSVVYLSERRTGVYRSSDAGLTWAPLNVGLRFRSVGALALSGDSLHLYAATEGGGVYRLDLSGSAPEKYRVPAAASLTRPKPSTTSVPRSGSFTVAGSVRPGHATAGKLVCERYAREKWSTVASYARTWTSSLSGAYTVSYRLPAGKYRFRATHGSSAATSCHLPGSSASSVVVTVR